MTSGSRARRRIPNACRICRQRKVKCSGSQPCTNCTTRGTECTFAEAERKVVVLEKHLRALQSRHPSRLNRSDIISDAQATANVSTTATGAASPAFRRSGLLRNAPSVEDTSLGNNESSSPWLYLRDARRALTLQLGTESWVPTGLGTSNDSSDGTALYIGPPAALIPDKEHISHLIETVDFHLNSLLFLFDQITLSATLIQPGVLALPATDSPCLSLLQVQLLAILALAKLLREKDRSGVSPPGVREFWTAENALPAAQQLLEQPVTAVETLCLLAWYAQALERHEIASLHVGQALRIIQVADFTRLPHTSGIAKLERTVTCLDLRLSAALNRGNRGSVHSSSILPQPLESESVDTRLQILDIGIAISLVLKRAADASNALSRSACGDSFHASASDRAEAMALLEELQAIGRQLVSKSWTCSSAESRIEAPLLCIRELHLWYCHSIITVTLPYLLSDVGRESRSLRHDQNNEQGSPGKICAKYAYLALSMLLRLHDQGCLEALSFFKVELLVMSTLALVAGDFAREQETAECLIVTKAFGALKDMEYRGSMTASRALKQLQYIKTTVEELPRIQQGLSGLDPSVIAFDGNLLSKEQLDIFGTHTAAGPPSGLTATGALRTEEELPSSAAGPFLDLGADDDFTFSMEDLQWLDAVQ